MDILSVTLMETSWMDNLFKDHVVGHYLEELINRTDDRLNEIHDHDGDSLG